MHCHSWYFRGESERSGHPVQGYFIKVFAMKFSIKIIAIGINLFVQVENLCSKVQLLLVLKN